MSERGVFAVDRGVWDHPLLQSDEPFSRREAWLWLISEAAWKPRRRKLAGRLVDLRRGQYAGSLRFLAKAWGWSEARVRRFLEALASDAMIDASCDAGVTVITICNYDDYQRVSLPSDAPPDAPCDAGPTQDRRKDKDMETKEDLGGGGDAQARDLPPRSDHEPRPTGSMITPEAHTLAEELARLAGVGTGPDTPPGWCGAAYRVQTWLSRGWSRDVVLIGARSSMANKRDGPPFRVEYFEPAIAREHERAARPLPVAQQEPSHAAHWHQPAAARRPPGSGGLAVLALSRARAARP